VPAATPKYSDYRMASKAGLGWSMNSTLLTRCAVCLLVLIPTSLDAQVDGASTVGILSSDAFVVRPGNILSITVWPDETLGGDYSVEDSGLVFVPILGGVQVAGLSLDAVRTLLRDGFGRAMQSPVVTVTPLFNVGVLGAVVRPGLYQVDPSSTIFDVIALAGGLHRDAKDDGVTLLRGDQVIPLASPESPGLRGVSDVLRLQVGDRISVRRGGGIPVQVWNLGLQFLVLTITILNLNWR